MSSTIDLDQLKVGQLIAHADAPGDAGFITGLAPTSDGRGTRITRCLIAYDVSRRTVNSRVWPDDHARFVLYGDDDYDLDALRARYGLTDGEAQ